jgi:pectate lyase
MIAFEQNIGKADGFGKFATGGRNGQVLLVTNLNNTGEGSLRWALTQTFPRIIIPVVSGYINLTTNINLNSTHGDFTYLGFLAPSLGLVVRHGAIRITGVSNYIIRGLKVKASDFRGVEIDAIDVNDCTNFIIDRSSFFWGTDETASFARCRDFTIQYTMIAEGLDDSVHSKGQHGYGSIMGAYDYSLHHNIWANFRQRVPSIGISNGPIPITEIFDVRNNIFFNWIHRCVESGANQRGNIVHNYFQPGPAQKSEFTRQRMSFQWFRDNLDDIGRFCLIGNYNHDFPNLAWQTLAGQKLLTHALNGTIYNAFVNDVILDELFEVPTGLYSFSETAFESREIILEHCGYPVRDPDETRIINQIINNNNLNNDGTPVVGNKTGLFGIIDSQNDVGGFSPIEELTDDRSSAEDGIPDDWKIANGLLVSTDYGVAGNPDTHPYLFAPSGRRWQEEYASELIDGIVIEEEFTLTVTAGDNGTVNTSGGDFAPSTSVFLQAFPASGFRLLRWERLTGDTWTQISTSTSFNFLMPSQNTQVRALFTPISQGNKFFARKKQNI